ncbi:translation factor [Thermococcus profundus]|uniref:Translation factor n=1 Tax=Thermococcus profundus TaxID=49899 RepID=A0A2Z2MC01_THEPR|nr:tRNA-binding protein Pbp11 [Thermococcus profundus]ASJ02202.1 translation factor [Thermococcus profundus]
MGLLGFLRRGNQSVEVVSRRPTGRFRVEKKLTVLNRQVLVGEVVEGIIYPGYKVKGRKASPVMRIEKDHREVEFAISGDKVALILEREIPCEKGEDLEIYQS